MSRKRKIFLSILSLMLLGIVTASFLLDKNWQVEKPRLQGQLWTAAAPGDPDSAVVLMTREERGYRESVGTSRRSAGIYRTKYYYNYWLEVRKAPVGSLLKRSAIATIKHETKKPAPYILGIAPEGIWLSNSGLELRALDTLDVLLTEKTIREKNPNIAALWPSQMEKFKVSRYHDGLIFQGTNLEYYLIDGKTGTIEPADRTKLEQVEQRGTLQAKFNRLQSNGIVWVTGNVSKFTISTFGTSTNQWYALISEDKRKQAGRWPLRDERPYGDEWRSLYRTPFWLDHSNKIEIDPEKIEAVGTAKLLNGGFLQRGERAVWDVPNPSSSLVLHKDNVDKTTPWKIGRLTREGELLWSVSTGLADLQASMDAGSAVAFYGFGNFTEPTSDRPGMIVFVDWKTGKVHSHDLTNPDNSENNKSGAKTESGSRSAWPLKLFTSS